MANRSIAPFTRSKRNITAVALAIFSITQEFVEEIQECLTLDKHGRTTEKRIFELTFIVEDFPHEYILKAIKIGFRKGYKHYFVKGGMSIGQVVIDPFEGRYKIIVEFWSCPFDEEDWGYNYDSLQIHAFKSEWSVFKNCVPSSTNLSDWYYNTLMV